MPSQIESSVNLLKDLDVDRTLFMLKRKEAAVDEDGESEGSLVLNRANKLAEDLFEEENTTLVGIKEPTVLSSKSTRARRKKVSVEGSTIRRSARLKRNI